jgi:hypothetical protein
MLVIFNWVVFEEKLLSSYKYIVYWLVFPILYCVFSLIRGLFDGFYPYFFLNPNGDIPIGVGSYTNVILFIIGYAFVFAFLGFLVVVNKVVQNYKTGYILRNKNNKKEQDF